MKYLSFFIIYFFIAGTLLAQSYKTSGNEVIPSRPITFEAGTADITSESEEGLESIKQYLSDKSYISLLRVEGHLDANGKQELSEQRALAVCKKLVAMGVDCKRLIAVGFGNTKPIADNTTPEGKSQNRRISFMNAAIKGHPIGGMPTDGGGVVAGEVCQ